MLREFKKDALLRVHDFGFERTDAKEGGVEQVGILDQAASANVVWIVAQAFINARAKFLRREERDGFDGVAEVAPKLVWIGRAGKAPAHADDRDGIAGVFEAARCEAMWMAA